MNTMRQRKLLLWSYCNHCKKKI